MSKKSCPRLLPLVALCAVVWMWSFVGLIPFSGFEKSKPMDFTILSQAWAAAPAKPASPNTSAQSSSPAGQSQVKKHSLPLIVQRLYLKTDQVWITLARSGKTELHLEDYPHILVKVAGSKTTGSGQWTLAQVDSGYALLNPKGKIDFDTQLVLKKTERLTATITFGTWKHTKQEALTPPSILTSAPAGQSAAPPTPTNLPARASGPAKPAATPPTPVPMGGGFSGVSMQSTISAGQLIRPAAPPGGLTFSVPGAGQTVIAGDTLYFILRFERSIAEGDLTLTLRRAGYSAAQATATYHYRPIEGEWLISSTFAIPARNIAAADDYFLYAVHAAGNAGVSPIFAVHLPGTEGLIRFIKPATRDVSNPGNSMRVNYQMTRSTASGLIRFEMFTRYGHRPVLSWTSDYRAQPAGVPQPVYLKTIRLPADLPLSNNYFIQASHAEGSGRSGTFSIAPLINHGGAEVVEDIAVTDIFKDASGKVKVRARVTGASWPLWVQWNHTSIAISLLLHPGDNEFTLDTAPFNGTGGDCSRNYTVSLDPYNRYTEVNETNNKLEKTLFFLEQNGKLSVRDHPWLDSTLRIGCNMEPHQVAFDFVLNYCGTESFNVSGLVRDVRQSGTLRRTPTSGGPYDEAFDQSIPYELLVFNDSNPVGLIRDGSVSPGYKVYVRIRMDDFIHHVDSNVTLTLNAPAASWPGIRNPLTIRIAFGGRDNRTGECVYH